LNVCISNWEFTGPRGVPLSFVAAYNTYDIVIGKSAWTALNYRTCGTKNVKHMMLGCDLSEFYPSGDVIPRQEYGIQEDATLLLWVGGTDKRHGFDIAASVMDALPDDYWLVAKQSAHYPPQPIEHDRITIVRNDLPSLAPVYRMADVLLHTARGVGSSMPVFEALACGLQVVSSDLPPIREIASLHPVLANSISFGDVTLEYAGQHHLHHDCQPYWYEPDVPSLVTECARAAKRSKLGRSARFEEARQKLSWERAVDELERHIADAN
jgi:glycosyltransferase involved in cell wall biosynthesis